MSKGKGSEQHRQGGLVSAAATLLPAAAALLLTGCSAMTSSNAPSRVVNVAMSGTVHGGQQPISGSTMYLFAAGTTGYGSTNTNMLTRTVLTDAGGGFNLAGAFSCSAGQQLYLVAVGGNPGAGMNKNAAEMAAIGDCSSINSSTFISINELTTIGSVFALAPFMNSYAAIGTSPSNTAGLAQAAASVNKLVNIAAGSAVGSALPSGAVGPTAEINTLGDIIAACINSAGGVAGDNSPCGSLFSLATPPGGTAPTDTIQAALNIAKNPALNVASLYYTVLPTAPFRPSLTVTPTDWTLSITYTAGGFNAPSSTTIDANGNVWVANSGNNTVTQLSAAGAPAASSPFLGNGLNAPAAIAIDAGGDAWVANKGGASLSVFTSSGAKFSGSPFTGNGLSAPVALAIDAPGNVWVANSGANAVSEFSSAGAAVGQMTTGVTTPAAIAIDPR